MGYWARVKSLAGRNRSPIPTVASASNVVINESNDTWNVTGTTGITTMNSSGVYFPGRVVVLVGTDGTGPAITDTAVASTAQGKFHLSAAITLVNGTTLTVICGNNGSWWEIGRSVNG